MLFEHPLKLTYLLGIPSFGGSVKLKIDSGWLQYEELGGHLLFAKSVPLVVAQF